MSNFQQLMVTEQASLTKEEAEFVAVHSRILSCGDLSGRAFVEMCYEIKRMRDGKLYLAAGFESFGEYAESALNVKERQAYNYAKAAEDYSSAYLEEHARLGITKLGMLAKLTAGEREEIEEEVDLEESSTRELDAKIQEIIRERDEAQRQLDLFTGQFETLESKLEESKSEKSALQEEFDRKKEQLEAEQKLAAELKQKKKDLEKELREAKSAAKEVKTVPDEESKKIADRERARAEELESKLRETNAQLAAAREQKKTIASDELLVFKVKFEDLQRLGDDIAKALSVMSEENRAKCKNALNAVFEGWKEEMAL